MNVTALVGVAVLALVIVFAAVTSGIPLLALWNLPSVLIVVGGTLAATLISYNMRELTGAVRSLAIVFRTEHDQSKRDAQDMLTVARAWIRGDMAALRSVLGGIESPFLRLGLEMITDNVIPLTGVVETLRKRIDKLRAKERAEAQIFRAMAGYAPAFGMLGTLFGLVQMLGSVSASNITAITSGLAVALLTTMYGVVLSYALFRPFAAKLEHRTEVRVKRMQIILEALCLMAQTRSPGILKEFTESVNLEFKDELARGGSGPDARAS
jgi:chemotaxis protein MotA